ncbi:hypothetical protein [Rhodoblastus sp.]|uniref:hypothetical protein n=1 Tax=Rhodoblastus sp. TaxID=1962975 RepID=UPI003F9ABA2A
MTPDDESDFEEFFAIHPHWTGHLLLSKSGNTLLLKGANSTGTYERKNDVLSVRWERFPPETFILRGSVFVREGMEVPNLETITEGTALHPQTISRQYKTVSVLTDAVSGDFYFPLWHKYYGQLFGESNLHVISFGGDEHSFSKFELGGLEVAPGYEEFDRAKRVSDKCSELLHHTDLVIRCDVDEFIVPDPRKYGDLKHYISELQLPYVTAYGYNIIQEETDSPLDLQAKILTTQRRYAYPIDALCKTCIVSSPTRWDVGFHNASTPPKFHELYIFHLKLADLAIQAKIGAMVALQASADQLKAYHTTPKEYFQQEAQRRLARSISSGFEAFAARYYFDDYLRRVNYRNGLFGYTGFTHGAATSEIPEEFAGYF